MLGKNSFLVGSEDDNPSITGGASIKIANPSWLASDLDVSITVNFSVEHEIFLNKIIESLCWCFSKKFDELGIEKIDLLMGIFHHRYPGDEIFKVIYLYAKGMIPSFDDRIRDVNSSWEMTDEKNSYVFSFRDILPSLFQYSADITAIILEKIEQEFRKKLSEETTLDLIFQKFLIEFLHIRMDDVKDPTGVHIVSVMLTCGGVFNVRFNLSKYLYTESCRTSSSFLDGRHVALLGDAEWYVSGHLPCSTESEFRAAQKICKTIFFIPPLSPNFVHFSFRYLLMQTRGAQILDSQHEAYVKFGLDQFISNFPAVLIARSDNKLLDNKLKRDIDNHYSFQLQTLKERASKTALLESSTKEGAALYEGRHLGSVCYIFNWLNYLQNIKESSTKTLYIKKVVSVWCAHLAESLPKLNAYMQMILSNPIQTKLLLDLFYGHLFFAWLNGDKSIVCNAFSKESISSVGAERASWSFSITRLGQTHFITIPRRSMVDFALQSLTAMNTLKLEESNFFQELEIPNISSSTFLNFWIKCLLSPPRQLIPLPIPGNTLYLFFYTIYNKYFSVIPAEDVAKIDEMIFLERLQVLEKEALWKKFAQAVLTILAKGTDKSAIRIDASFPSLISETFSAINKKEFDDNLQLKAVCVKSIFEFTRTKLRLDDVAIVRKNAGLIDKVISNAADTKLLTPLLKLAAQMIYYAEIVRSADLQKEIEPLLHLGNIIDEERMQKILIDVCQLSLIHAKKNKPIHLRQVLQNMGEAISFLKPLEGSFFDSLETYFKIRTPDLDKPCFFKMISMLFDLKIAAQEGTKDGDVPSILSAKVVVQSIPQKTKTSLFKYGLSLLPSKHHEYGLSIIETLLIEDPRFFKESLIPILRTPYPNISAGLEKALMLLKYIRSPLDTGPLEIEIILVLDFFKNILEKEWTEAVSAIHEEIIRKLSIELLTYLPPTAELGLGFLNAVESICFTSRMRIMGADTDLKELQSRLFYHYRKVSAPPSCDLLDFQLQEFQKLPVDRLQVDFLKICEHLEAFVDEPHQRYSLAIMSILSFFITMPHAGHNGSDRIAFEWTTDCLNAFKKVVLKLFIRWHEKEQYQSKIDNLVSSLWTSPILSKLLIDDRLSGIYQLWSSKRNGMDRLLFIFEKAFQYNFQADSKLLSEKALAPTLISYQLFEVYLKAACSAGKAHLRSFNFIKKTLALPSKEKVMATFSFEQSVTVFKCMIDYCLKMDLRVAHERTKNSKFLKQQWDLLAPSLLLLPQEGLRKSCDEICHQLVQRTEMISLASQIFAECHKNYARCSPDAIVMALPIRREIRSAEILTEEFLGSIRNIAPGCSLAMEVAPLDRWILLIDQLSTSKVPELWQLGLDLLYYLFNTKNDLPVEKSKIALFAKKTTPIFVEIQMKIFSYTTILTQKSFLETYKIFIKLIALYENFGIKTKSILLDLFERTTYPEPSLTCEEIILTMREARRQFPIGTYEIHQACTAHILPLLRKDVIQAIKHNTLSSSLIYLEEEIEIKWFYSILQVVQNEIIIKAYNSSAPIKTLYASYLNFINFLLSRKKTSSVGPCPDIIDVVRTLLVRVVSYPLIMKETMERLRILKRERATRQQLIEIFITTSSFSESLNAKVHAFQEENYQTLMKRPYQRSSIREVIENPSLTVTFADMNPSVFIQNFLGAIIAASVEPGDLFSTPEDVHQIYSAGLQFLKIFLESPLCNQFSGKVELFKKTMVDLIEVAEIYRIYCARIVADEKELMEMIDQIDSYVLAWFDRNESSVKMISPEIIPRIQFMTARLRRSEERKELIAGGVTGSS